MVSMEYRVPRERLEEMVPEERMENQDHLDRLVQRVSRALLENLEIQALMEEKEKEEKWGLLVCQVPKEILVQKEYTILV